MKKPFMYARTDNGVYTIAYPVGKHWMYVSTGKKNKSDANTFYDEWKRNKGYEVVNKKIIFSEFMNVYYDIVKRDVGTKALKNCITKVKYFLDFLDDKPLNEYSTVEIDKFLSRLIDKKRSPYTVDGYRRQLSTIFNSAVKWKYITSNPVKATRAIVLPEPEIKSFTHEQFNKLIQEIDIYNTNGLENKYKTSQWKQYYKDLFTFAVLSGLRFNELKFLKTYHVSIDKKLISVFSDSYHKTKDKESRKVEMHPALAPICKRYSNREFMFISFESKMINPDRITKQLKKFNKLAGNPPYLNFESFRKTFGVWLLEGGSSLEFVSSQLGHASIETTQKWYAKLITKEFKGEINKINYPFK
jgi:integrase